MTQDDSQTPNTDQPEAEAPSSSVPVSQELQRIQELEIFLEERSVLLDQEKEKALRALADLQNVRRRSEEERSKARTEGASDILLAVFKAIENFSRAFEHLPEHLKDDEWVKGLFSIEKGLSDSLLALGVEFIGEMGVPVDHARHEALSIDPQSPVGTVASIFERGIVFRGKVLQPAKVVVGGQEQENQESENEESSSA